jgi:uncharacterized protein YjbI with pentapeptide repeats
MTHPLTDKLCRDLADLTGTNLKGANLIDADLKNS